MARAPTPVELARILRQLSDRLDDTGTHKAARCRCILCRAEQLAARGYPTSTNGAEGGRSSDSTSSTERAALNPDPRFNDIDGRLREHMRLCEVMARMVHNNLDVIMAHASDEDPIPAGTGVCAVEGCDHFCNPRKNPNDRLRAGFCPKHHKRWLRERQPDRGEFIRTTETEDVA